MAALRRSVSIAASNLGSKRYVTFGASAKSASSCVKSIGHCAGAASVSCRRDIAFGREDMAKGGRRGCGLGSGNDMNDWRERGRSVDMYNLLVVNLEPD